MSDQLEVPTMIIPEHNEEDPFECEDGSYHMQELPLHHSQSSQHDPSEHYLAMSSPRDPNLDIPQNSVASPPCQYRAEIEGNAAQIERQEQLDAIESARGQSDDEVMAQLAQMDDAVLIAANQRQCHRQQNTTSPMVRHSERLKGKSPIKTYSVKRKKANRSIEAGEVSVRARLTDSDLMRAIEVVNLEPTPIQEGLANQIDDYCGILRNDLGANMASDVRGLSNSRAAPNEVEDEEQIEEQEDQVAGTQGNESVLGALEFDSADDLSDEEEEGN